MGPNRHRRYDARGVPITALLLSLTLLITGGAPPVSAQEPATPEALVSEAPAPDESTPEPTNVQTPVPTVEPTVVPTQQSTGAIAVTVTDTRGTAQGWSM